MKHGIILHDHHINAPADFLNEIIRDIPATALIDLLKKNPTLRDTVLEGYSARANKLPQLLQQPALMTRFRRSVQSDPQLLETVLELWGQEKLSIVAFLELLDRSFLLDNWAQLKDLVGPARFLAALYLLGGFNDPEIPPRIDDAFWQRDASHETVEPLFPLFTIWGEFVQHYPEAQAWLESLGYTKPSCQAQTLPPAVNEARTPAEESHREETLRRKLNKKLAESQEEKNHLQEQASRYRKENEDLRKQIAEWESAFEHRVNEALAEQRREWYERYQKVDDAPFEEAEERIAGLLRRAGHAFGLQRQADEKYGLIASVRQDLMQIELYLKEIERIFAESLVVHAEVAKVKEALLQERRRLLRLPGIERVLSKEPSSFSVEDLRRQIRLLKVAPENLPKIAPLQSVVNRLAALGFIEDPMPFLEEIQHKRRQIMEALYSQFQHPQKITPTGRHFKNLEDFVHSGESRKYDVYIDGYNILLKIHGENRALSDSSLAAIREEFIGAVRDAGKYFRKIFLVFDGIEYSRDRRGNVDIIYTDKQHGTTADAFIIRELRRRGDKLSLLVTADQEIIEETEDRVYALVDPYHFYAFVYNTHLPVLGDT
jgi:hypothetical protein